MVLSFFLLNPFDLDSGLYNGLRVDDTNIAKTGSPGRVPPIYRCRPCPALGRRRCTPSRTFHLIPGPPCETGCHSPEKRRLPSMGPGRCCVSRPKSWVLVETCWGACKLPNNSALFTALYRARARCQVLTNFSPKAVLSWGLEVHFLHCKVVQQARMHATQSHTRCETTTAIASSG